MTIKVKSIGSFEAKTHLSRLIDEVQKGEEYVITKRGKPVAKLTPYSNQENVMKVEDILAQFDFIRNRIKGKVSIKEYINEGRKH